jgi:hypothetical protein
MSQLSNDTPKLLQRGLQIIHNFRRHLKYNITVNLLDGAFYGLGVPFRQHHHHPLCQQDDTVRSDIPKGYRDGAVSSE